MNVIAVVSDFPIKADVFASDDRPWTNELFAEKRPEKQVIFIKWIVMLAFVYLFDATRLKSP